MNINEALWILDRTYTRDNDLTGFIVERLPTLELSGVSPADYIEAWGTLRNTLRHGDDTCNICRQTLVLGCCNPGRPAKSDPNDADRNAYDGSLQPAMTIQRPIFLRDKQIAALELRLRNLAEEYARIAPNERFTFFWRNMTNGFRNRGKLLPGNTAVRNSQDRAGAEPGNRHDSDPPDRA